MKSASATAAAFPVSMKGQRVRVRRPYFECSVSSLKRRDEGEHSYTLLELKSCIEFPSLSVGEELLLEGQGLRCHCKVYSLPQTPVKTQEEDGLPKNKTDQEEDEGVFVAVQDCHVSLCSACASLELPMPVPLLPDGLKDKTVRFSRLSLQSIEVNEARVTEIEGCRPSLSIVDLEMLAGFPTPFCMGDLVVLESMQDSLCQWEGDVRFDVQWQWEAFGRSDSDSKLDNSHISVHVRTAEANIDPELFHQPMVIYPLKKPMVILVKPVPNSYHLTDNGRGAALKKASKATVSETLIAKPKIKIGISGYGSTGRAIARIALESEDVDLVAINDSAITMDQMTCMFRDRHGHGQWLSSDFKIKVEDPNKLMFGDKEVTIFRDKEPGKIPWKEVGAEYIVEARADKSNADYYENRTRNYVHYIDMSDSIFKNHLCPLAKILHDRFKEAEDVACRTPILRIRPHNPNAAKALGEVLVRWNGESNAMKFRVPAVDAPPIDLAIVLDEYKGYRLISSNTKPSSGF